MTQNIKQISNEISDLIRTCTDFNRVETTRNNNLELTDIKIYFNDGSYWHYTLASGNEYNFSLSC